MQFSHFPQIIFHLHKAKRPKPSNRAQANACQKAQWVILTVFNSKFSSRFIGVQKYILRTCKSLEQDALIDCSENLEPSRKSGNFSGDMPKKST